MLLWQERAQQQKAMKKVTKKVDKFRKMLDEAEHMVSACLWMSIRGVSRVVMNWHGPNDLGLHGAG